MHDAPFILPAALHFDVTSTYGLVDALGGAAAVASICSTAPTEVERWSITGRIPAGWHLQFFGEALFAGKSVDPRVFGFNTSDRAAQGLSRLMWLAHRATIDGGADAA